MIDADLAALGGDVRSAMFAQAKKDFVGIENWRKD